MKLVLVLLMSAVAVGQTTCHLHENNSALRIPGMTFYNWLDGNNAICADMIHFAKTKEVGEKWQVSVFTSGNWKVETGEFDTKSEAVRFANTILPHKRKPSVKPNFIIQCEGVCGKGPQVSSKDVLPCDGISCVGPVEMLPGKKCDDCAAALLPQLQDHEIGAGSGKASFAPDKAAVPVEPTAGEFQFTTVAPPSFTIMSQDDGCLWQGFQYDAKTRTCSMRIVFDVNSQVVCTPLVLNEQEKPEMTCSFKVIDKTSK